MKEENGYAAEELISPGEVEEQVRLIARRLALLYHYFGEVLEEELGSDRAKAIMSEVVWRYGTECGQEVRKKVENLGLPLTAENYRAVPDLPKYGWEGGLTTIDGEIYPEVTYCPFAEVWLEKGSSELGRLYCFVDQAKYAAYNDVKCVHLKNLLDDDKSCVFLIEDQEEKK